MQFKITYMMQFWGVGEGRGVWVLTWGWVVVLLLLRQFRQGMAEGGQFQEQGRRPEVGCCLDTTSCWFLMELLGCAPGQHTGGNAAGVSCAAVGITTCRCPALTACYLDLLLLLITAALSVFVHKAPLLHW
jgi:hypothetical protein